MRNDQLLRQLRLLRLLQRGRRTLHSLAGELAVTTRTVRRDFEVLSSAGFPVQRSAGDYGDDGYWHVGHDGRCPVCDAL